MVRGISFEAARAVRQIMLSDLHRDAKNLCERPRAESMAARAFRLFWLAIVLGHVMIAGLWWWLQPGGFPLGHPRFWSNGVAPFGALVVALAALWALHRERIEALCLLLPVFPAAWLAIAVAARVLFPISLAWKWLVPAGAAAAMALSIMFLRRRMANRTDDTVRGRAALFGSITSSALAGVILVCTQRVPAPSTHPSNPRFPLLDRASSTSIVQPGAVHLEGRVLVQSFDGTVVVPLGNLTLMLEPILLFPGRSPDGCPTVLVDPLERTGPEPRFRDGCRQAERSCSLVFDVPGQGPAFLDVRAGGDGHAVQVEAVTRLERRVYSHLNSFCDVTVHGHRKLALEFSPCPGAVIEVRPFDYPVGRPARFAFLDDHATFRVVEAETGEKGPYRLLASGRLERGEPLSITLVDQGRPAGRITLEDWARQLDFSLSPTAGWRVPVNAIEFSLSGDAPESSASIFVTLAGTSVGRGWDCVGHAAGTYRNRIRFERIANSGASAAAASRGDQR